MMAKDANERYQEPIEVAEALSEWADLPMDPPPAKEMPGLCPLVLTLTGHCLDKLNGSTSAVPLGRAIFGPGRSALRGGSSGRHKTNGTAATVETDRVNGSRTRSNAGRVSGTASRPARRRAPEPESEEAAAPPKSRTKWIVLGTILLTLLAVGSVVGAFFLGKMNP